MTSCPEIVVERAAAAVGRRILDNAAVTTPESVAATGFAVRRAAADGTSLLDLSLQAAEMALDGFDRASIGGVVCATFSHADRFPALAVKVAGALSLPRDIPALDLQMACSAYPYAVYAAGRLAADSGKPVLVVDGDIQSRLVDGSDPSTAPLFSDAATASVVTSSAASGAVSRFSFLSSRSDALQCPAGGPVGMDGFKVFSFVASDVVRLLREFGDRFDMFIPHQANMYMVRQLAKSLGLTEKLLTCGAEYANPGSCSIPLAVAAHGRAGRALLAGFGAGFSAAACTVRLAGGVAAGVSAETAAEEGAGK